MRGNTFEELVTMTRGEARLFTSTSRGVDNMENIKTIIKRYYETLYDEHDWDFKRGSVEKALAAGQRYYDVPEMDMNRIERIELEQNGRYYPMTQGITPLLFNSQDSNAGEGSSLPQRWDTHNDNQIEVWPIPQDNVSKLWLTGIKRKTELVDENSRCDIDDILISLYAGAELLSSMKAPDADKKLKMANDRLFRLKALHRNREHISIGEADEAAPVDRTPRVAYVRTP